MFNNIEVKQSIKDIHINKEQLQIGNDSYDVESALMLQKVTSLAWKRVCSLNWLQALFLFVKIIKK